MMIKTLATHAATALATLAIAGGAAYGTGLLDAPQVAPTASVSVQAHTDSPTAPHAATGRLDLNTATTDELVALPGIGTKLADRIVAWRTEHGPFVSVAQLVEVPRMPGATATALAELVTV